ncbi:MAG TPA: hypothetical protein PKC18_04600 [Lacipirellulaceae bacterium]|nr:hypothetical protein [Lacipirellulaceae bacterium]
MRMTWIVALALAIAPVPSRANESADSSWQATLERWLPRAGHRNWIAVVDAAYPDQTSSGVEMVVTDEEHLKVVRHVLDRLQQAEHVRPVLRLDAELPHVALADAPEIDQYRADLAQLLAGREAARVPHEEIIDRLDAAGQKFRVLVLKTTMTLPYTSVFIELDCGYWSTEAEQRLRRAMETGSR